MQLKIKIFAMIISGAVIAMMLSLLIWITFISSVPSVNWSDPGFTFSFNESKNNTGSYLDMHYVKKTKVDVAIIRPSGIIGNDSVPPSDGRKGLFLANDTTYRFLLNDSEHDFVMTFFANGLPNHLTVYYHIPFFTVKKVESGNKTYLDVNCYQEQPDKKKYVSFSNHMNSEIKNLYFVSGTDGNDSVPSSAGLIDERQTYRFVLNSSAERLVGFARIDGKDVEIFNCSQANLSENPEYYSRYPLI